MPPPATSRRGHAGAGDAQTLHAVEAALELSTAAVVDERLWNSTHKFFRCHTADGDQGDNQIFTDTLYGQMLHHHHFDGNYSIPTSYVIHVMDCARTRHAFPLV